VEVEREAKMGSARRVPHLSVLLVHVSIRCQGGVSSSAAAGA